MEIALALFLKLEPLVNLQLLGLVSELKQSPLLQLLIMEILPF
jgi:hypothetical protein